MSKTEGYIPPAIISAFAICGGTLKMTFLINPYREVTGITPIDLEHLYQLVNSDLGIANADLPYKSFMIQQLPPVISLANSYLYTMHIKHLDESDFNDLSKQLRVIYERICTEREQVFQDNVPIKFTRQYTSAVVFIVKLDLAINWQLSGLMGKMNKLANLAAYNGILVQALINNLNPLVGSISQAISLMGQRRPQVYGFILGRSMSREVEQLHSNFNVLRKS